ncbi:diacylglycerol/lipid kinase family protein [Guptibacillus hwajinpoensis]|uniref:diacylglycerol/lipid kinase family protein n=1 Tax=Guptibacillus hwajinpoensis TaxID=208199 RepID=UPI001883B9B3|nr:diacylglycerol kinase family protein [Pseudalkalibacillus hwajinpoensis]MBF0707993.1 diacylglycerol kinase family lipid kinase [Pseudalkalibacillus hwajinpoensis]
MKRAMLIINPSSGKEKAMKYEDEAVAILEQNHVDVTVKYTEKEGDAVRFARAACENHFNTVVAMGGDGTINEAVNGLARETERPDFGFVPLGTVNDFARALNIPMQPKKALEVLSEQHTKPVDIGRINDQYFMNVLAVGAIAEAVYDVTADQKSKFGPLAYLIEGGKALKDKTPFDLNITYDGKQWDGKAYLMLIALTNSVGGIQSFAQHAEVNDGYFHVFILREFSLPKVFKIIPDLFSGKLQNNAQVEYFPASKLKVESGHELVVNIDGDEGIHLPFEAEVMHNELNIFVPKE